MTETLSPSSKIIRSPEKAEATSNIAPFATADMPMTAEVMQQMQQRFFQHFESAGFSTAIEPDHGEWLETPTHKHTLRFNVCERVAAKMVVDKGDGQYDRRGQDVWLGTQVDRGRSILQRLGLEITSAPRVIQDELNPHKCALEYDIDLKDKSGPEHAHDALPKLAQQIKEACSYYYNARKDALAERGEEYVEPQTAIAR